MTRRELREHCFKILFCIDFHSLDEMEQQIERYFEMPIEDELNEEGNNEILHQTAANAQDIAALRSKVRVILEHVPELDEKINTVALGWKTKRMGKVELVLLRIALYEMLHEEDIPDKVAVNEAVELAKKFGGKDASAFTNGILAKLI